MQYYGNLFISSKKDCTYGSAMHEGSFTNTINWNAAPCTPKPDKYLDACAPLEVGCSLPYVRFHSFALGLGCMQLLNTTGENKLNLPLHVYMHQFLEL